MTKQPVARLLDLLAAETAELAELAKRLDRLIPLAVADLPVSRRAELGDLQRVDALHQHLRDTSRALGKMADMVDASDELCAATLVAEVELDYFKRLLRGGHVEPAHAPGRPHLF